MAVYQVFAEMIEDLYAYVEADSEDEAYEYAKYSLDGEDFISEPTGEFRISPTVIEVEKEDIKNSAVIYNVNEEDW